MNDRGDTKRQFPGKNPSSRRERGRGRQLFWIAVAVAGVVAVLAFLPGFGRGQVRQGRGATGHEPFRDAGAAVEHVLDRLDATEQQRLIASAVLAGFDGERDRLRAELETLRAEMLAALEEEPLDRSRFERIEARARTLAADGATLGVELAYEVGRVLTPEQRDELLERWSER